MTRRELFASIVLAYLLNTVRAQDDPTNVACTVLSSSSIQLTWTQPTNTAVNGYHISVERVDGIINGTSIPTIVLSSYTYVSYTFHGLANFAQYNLSIHSYIGLTNYTDVFTTCTTNEDAPNGAPLNFNCTAISESEITCAWDALEQAYWNGVLQGYRIQWLGENVSQIFDANVSTSTYTYSVTSLATDTRYIFLLCGFTSVNYGTVYATDVETTLGAIIKPVENVTRYYCYEAVPGMIEIAWDEMPCTVYTGTIAGLMLVTLIMTSVLCCQCCQKAGPGGVEINVMNGPSRGHSSGSHHSFDDDNSTTETDTEDILEQDISDTEHHDGTESKMGESDKGTTANFDDFDNPFRNGPSRGHSDGSNHSFDDDNSTTETDAEEEQDISDTEQQDDAESKMGESDKGTPANFDDFDNHGDTERSYGTKTRHSSVTDRAETEFSDSDYNSDMEEDDHKGTKTKPAVKKNIKLHTIAKGKVVTATAGNHNDPNDSGSKCTETVDSPDEYEDWNPDVVGDNGKTNVSANKINGVTGDKSVVAASDINNPNNKRGPLTGTRQQTGELDRSVSVSSILVDTSANAYDSIWSPDITDDTTPEKKLPVANGIFRSKSSVSKKGKSIKVNENEKSNKPNIAGKTDIRTTVTRSKNVEKSMLSSVKHPTDTIDNINLDDLSNVHINKVDTNVEQFTNTQSMPAWLSQRQRDEIRKTTNKTPVQEVSIRQSTVIDIEPVLGADRIGKKFPFLNLDNLDKTNQGNADDKRKTFTTLFNLDNTKHGNAVDQGKNVTAFLNLDNTRKGNADGKDKTFKTNAWSRTGKTANVPVRKGLPKGSSIETTITVTDDVQSENEKQKQTTSNLPKDGKSQLFYGFGVSRFRKLAASWFNKMRMKKKVDLPNSKWD